MSSIFETMKEITAKTYDELLENIDSKRKQYTIKDYTIINDSNVKININDINEIPEGRFEVLCHDVAFDCLYKSSSSKRMFVFLNGGGVSPSAVLPIFKRWSYYKYLDGCILNIADPMYKKYKGQKLDTAWYYGSEDEAYLEYIIEIVLKIAKVKSLRNQDIVFFGSSAGGYAGLYCGCKIQGSNIIAINPQIRLTDYNNYKDLANILGVDLYQKDKFDRNDISDLIINNKLSKIVLIENCRSQWDMGQLFYLCSKLKPNPQMKYGISCLSSDIICWIYDAKMQPYHNAQEVPEVLWAIVGLLDVNKENISKYEELYLNLSEIWYRIYENKKEILTNAMAVKMQIKSENEGISYKKHSIINIPQIEVLANENIWNHKTIFSCFKPNTSYLLTIGNSICTTNNCNQFDIVIRNNMIQEVVLKTSCKISNTIKVIFSTTNNIEKTELRLYSGLVGHANGIGVKFLDVNLYELSYIEGKTVEI